MSNVEELLLSHDDCQATLAPDDFDFEAYRSRISSLRNRIKTRVGVDLSLDTTQDCTSYCELSIRARKELPIPHMANVISISFSNFGNLVTLSHDPTVEALPPILIQEISKELLEYGFVIVDSSALKRPYSGKNPYFVGETWMDRFFGYL